MDAVTHTYTHNWVDKQGTMTNQRHAKVSRNQAKVLVC